ncbi:hypothetical protein NE237_019530 [Protea cynaroides]|uniref:Uncharacterized protein n=1 Tax=Protea cynaroides TaxID=273540 RepID=A0A9Q0H7P3_9MAGN|nr:hypothetical protein NE237_019530 [Protea cynaroides]
MFNRLPNHFVSAPGGGQLTMPFGLGGALLTTFGMVKLFKVKAIVTEKLTVGGIFPNLVWEQSIDNIGDLVGKTLLLERVSLELDSITDLCFNLEGRWTD